VLVGSLIVMVMLSGYENFVSKLDGEAAQESLTWLGKLDSGTLKTPRRGLHRAISSIHLLRVFMNAQPHRTTRSSGTSCYIDIRRIGSHSAFSTARTGRTVDAAEISAAWSADLSHRDAACPVVQIAVV